MKEKERERDRLEDQTLSNLINKNSTKTNNK